MRLARFEQLLQPDAWSALAQRRGRGRHAAWASCASGRSESYDHVHHRGAGGAGPGLRRGGHIRFIHTSALGLHGGARSRFLSSKLLGERAIAVSGSDYAIVRPSLLDGEGGFGGALAARPVAARPCTPSRAARGSIAAMTAADLGLGLCASVGLACFPWSPIAKLNWAARAAMAMPEYLRALRADYTGTRALQLPLPNWMARVLACLRRAAFLSVLLWALDPAQRDNIPRPNRLPELLGREPHAIGSNRPRARPGPRWQNKASQPSRHDRKPKPVAPTKLSATSAPAGPTTTSTATSTTSSTTAGSTPPSTAC